MKDYFFVFKNVLNTREIIMVVTIFFIDITEKFSQVKIVSFIKNNKKKHYMDVKY